MRVMAAILLLGNIQFIDDGGFELDIKGNNGEWLWMQQSVYFTCPKNAVQFQRIW